MQVLRASLRRISNVISRNPSTYKVKSLVRTAFSDKYLLFTNVAISITLSGFGDYLEQRYEIYVKEIDCWNRTRTMHMGFSGMGIGFICHFWYKFLDRRMPGRTLGIVIKKMLLDQVVCSPLMISSFFISVAIFEDVTLEELKTEIRHKFLKLYAAEWVVWPPAQIINFYWLPTKYRVLYDNTISLGYDVFTSQVKHAKMPDKTVNETKIEKSIERQESLLLLDNKNSNIKSNILTVS